MTPVELVLSRLQDYRDRGNGKYIAKCPAHDDRSPSLSITEGRNGNAVMLCFAECSIDEICAALGLEVSDLFPHTKSHHAPPQKVRMALTDAFHCLQYESTIVAIAADILANGRALNEEEHNRLRLAVNKLNAVNEAVYG